ncbi:short chain dehydrogenase [Glycomyces harbinensis]|uniref:Short chain dehydrogenase n=1 Tax=Glycomyces harbinensis TaxID=58114 RepID=A0A1G6UBD3_9ACTN|nr:SDR family NAD(P)-dependent oxidoreductase [Glycomyces harbinensis]SDD38569.1 short chain dehydrogenase [Glycomyces harbinensis]
MKTIVITGGTSGIGQALATAYRDRGEQVVVIGPDPRKGRRFLDAAASAGAADRARFVQADLSLVAENRRVIAALKAEYPVIDALVLCARYFRSRRAVTAEGFEWNFALFYLSRFLLGHGLAEPMERAEKPVVMNVAGPGVGPPTVHWDDLEFVRGYHGWTAMSQGGRLNDLLAVAFAAGRERRTRYVLQFPGGTSTGLAGEFDAAAEAQIAEMKRHAQPVEAAIVPILAIMDEPPPEPLSAFVVDRRISLAHPNFDPGDAARLDALTRELLRARAELAGHLVRPAGGAAERPAAATIASALQKDLDLPADVVEELRDAASDVGRGGHGGEHDRGDDPGEGRGGLGHALVAAQHGRDRLLGLHGEREGFAVVGLLRIAEDHLPQIRATVVDLLAIARHHRAHDRHHRTQRLRNRLRGGPALGERIGVHRVLHQQQQLALVLGVQEQRARTDIGPVGDLLRGDLVDPALGEQRTGRGRDALELLLLVPLTSSDRRSDG